MDIKDILSKVDHTLLSQTATREVIRQVCEDGIRYSCASVCIPPSYVKEAKSFVGNKIKICTVIGFPNGYQTTSVKCFETRDAVENGADEIDMVINIGWLKDKRYDEILGDINSVNAACQGRILKVIIETCLLTDDEKIKMCELINASDADYIKTSTGFSKAGATVEDIKLFCDHINSDKKIKAAGGIASLEDAEVFLSIGASRLGTSRVVKLAKNL